MMNGHILTISVKLFNDFIITRLTDVRLINVS